MKGAFPPTQVGGWPQAPQRQGLACRQNDGALLEAL